MRRLLTKNKHRRGGVRAGSTAISLRLRNFNHTTLGNPSFIPAFPKKHSIIAKKNTRREGVRRARSERGGSLVRVCDPRLKLHSINEAIRQNHPAIARVCGNILRKYDARSMLITRLPRAVDNQLAKHPVNNGFYHRIHRVVHSPSLYVDGNEPLSTNLSTTPLQLWINKRSVTIIVRHTSVI
jgi:hypothetical protein